MIKKRNLDLSLTAYIESMMGLLPATKTYYVSRNIGASGDGSSWEAAFKTIGEGIAKLNADYTAGNKLPLKGRGRRLIIGEGWYSERPLTLSANDCHVVGVATGNHDHTVLYGSATAGAFNASAGGNALKITGHNNTIENVGFFTYDNAYASLQIGAPAGAVAGNKILGCNFVRDVADGALGGILCYDLDGTRIESCYFSTSCKDFGVKILSDGVVNPVNVDVIGCRFVGTPIGVYVYAGHNVLVDSNRFYNDTSDRADVVDYPIIVEGTAFCCNNYAMTSKANLITGNGTINDIGNYGSDSST